jgi:histidinol-phosphate aminotransferase
VAFRLRGALAERYGVTPPEVIHGHGSCELIELIVRTFATGEHHLVFSQPAFSMYQIIAMAHGVPYTAVPMRDQRHDLDGLLAAVTPSTRVLFIDNPNNPVGSYMPLDQVERLLREVPPSVIVVMDEAYFEYADAADYPNSLKLRHLRERLVVLRTFSKAYGLAGFRVGYGIGPAQLLDYINRIRAPFNVGWIDQEAALGALEDDDFVKRTRELNGEQRELLTKALEAKGFQVVPSQANFLLVDFGRSGKDLYEALLRQGVIVRPFGALPTSLRITVGTEAQNQRLLAALDEVL